MTLTHDRPEARALDGPEALADPQSHTLKHLGTTAMLAPAARPPTRSVRRMA